MCSIKILLYTFLMVYLRRNIASTANWRYSGMGHTKPWAPPQGSYSSRASLPVVSHLVSFLDSRADSNSTSNPKTSLFFLNVENDKRILHRRVSRQLIAKIDNNSYFFKKNMALKDMVFNVESKLPFNIIPVIKNIREKQPIPSFFKTLINLNSKKEKNTTIFLPFRRFLKNVERFDRQFYLLTFNALSSISSTERTENGLSFVESSLFLYLTLMTLSGVVDTKTKNEIGKWVELIPEKDRIELIRSTIFWLPKSKNGLKFKWSNKLIVDDNIKISSEFKSRYAQILSLKTMDFDKPQTPKELANTLNAVVVADSGGTIKNTFEAEDFRGKVRAVLITTLFLRCRWRAAPTLLNNTWPFYDASDVSNRTTHMIRINDMMNYGDLPDWNAEAIEISYSDPGLRLLMLVPRNRSIRQLINVTSSFTISEVLAKMQTMRVAVTLPLYTLRMTLLLPNKLRNMGISRLFDLNDTTDNSVLRISHGVQRIMFWSEAGRNAFKDDGLEWDEVPDHKVIINRPYIFYVRWHNVTLMKGNFVL